MQFLRIKNWEKFQHYKDRSAPWIKLYRDMMDSEMWVMGSDASKLLATCTMLLAVRTDNKIPLETAYIRRVCHLEIEPDFSELLKFEFIEIIDENGVCKQDASSVLAKCTSEERREEERREDTTASKKPEADADFEDAWKAYPKRAGGNPKGRALKAWRARRKEGADVTDLKAGVIRYAAFIRATGKDGTEFIMQAATFFGPDRQFLEPWNPPQEKAKPVDWWASDAATEAKGQELGLSPRAGEGWPQFKDRIRAKLTERIAA